MNKTRLEAFSDGVFAIAITILVLNITVEEADHFDLRREVVALYPKMLSYIISFMLIGLYWIGHHFYSERIKQVDGTFVFLNLVFLMCISFMPFPTFLLGKYPDAQAPLIIYGCTLLATNLVSFIMVVYLNRNRHLTNQLYKDEFMRQQVPLFFWINLLYVAAIGASFYMPAISYGIYILLILAGIKVYIKRMNAEVNQ